jgi:hypothetical protein
VERALLPAAFDLAVDLDLVYATHSQSIFAPVGEDRDGTPVT